MKFKKIFLYLFFSGSFLNLMSGSPALRGYWDDLFIHLDDKLLIAQEEFEEIYRALLEKDFFSEDEKKLILKGAIDNNILETGPVLLNLIEWGQKNKQDDPMTQVFIHKLNRYFYFVFRNFVNEMDIDKKIKGPFYDLSLELYKFKISNESSSSAVFQQFIYPFRSTLSKAMLFILIVNSTDLSYEEKVKHLVYYLDKIKRELIEIKKTLTGCSLKDDDIHKFIEFLQVYSIPEPLLMVKHFKFIFKAMAVIFACMIVIVLVVYFSLPYLIEPVRTISDDWAKKVEGAVAKTEGYKDGLLDYLASHWYTRWAVGARDIKKKEDPKTAQHDVDPQPAKQAPNNDRTGMWMWFRRLFGYDKDIPAKC